MIVEKPWGYEKIWAHTDKYVGKLLHINDGEQLSLQYHEVKDETVYIMYGTLTIVLDKEEHSNIILEEGNSYRITPNTLHRFAAKHGMVELIEVSTPELDDVVRVQDDYGRENAKV